jgi:hypothetical protein
MDFQTSMHILVRKFVPASRGSDGSHESNMDFQTSMHMHESLTMICEISRVIIILLV